MKIGILPLGRPTFDVPYAEQNLALMLEVLDDCGHKIVGPRSLLFDVDAAQAAMAELQHASIDHLLILQVTFTDACAAVNAGIVFDRPLAIWAIPEPRLAGRLRLNAFCGLNLASHALGLNNRAFSWAYIDPKRAVAGDIDDLLGEQRRIERLDGVASSQYASEEGAAVARKVRGKRIGRIGRHPDGFDTCAYSASRMQQLSGVVVDELELDILFDAAGAASNEATNEVMNLARSAIGGLETVDAGELDKSLRLKVALDTIRAEGSYDAFAIRCWPETFTQYGGAVCGPVSMLGEQKVPCACEADVYGALTQLILQEVAQAPIFLADLVDMDVGDNTGVVWHCGQAPISMRQPDVKAEATIHTNRKMPLLYEFPLKAGIVTFMRISQAFGETKMILAGARMLDRPMAFTGTSGIVRFERDINLVLDDLIASGAEHHMALTYGEHRPLLRSVAAAMKLPLMEL
jgi:L-fucose isomerase-like protein